MNDPLNSGSARSLYVHWGWGMLFAFAIVLFVLWLLGVVGAYAIGEIVHLLLVVALILFVFGLRRILDYLAW